MTYRRPARECGHTQRVTRECGSEYGTGSHTWRGVRGGELSEGQGWGFITGECSRARHGWLHLEADSLRHIYVDSLHRQAGRHRLSIREKTPYIYVNSLHTHSVRVHICGAGRV